MNLFDFVEYENDKEVNVVDMRAIIIGFRIVWGLRHDTPKNRKKEQLEWLKNHIKYMKNAKRAQPQQYENARRLSTQPIF